MRKIRTAEVGCSSDDCQHVIDEGEMKHFLSCYIRYDSFPFCNGLQLVASQFLACPTFETESREKIFAHYHMLQSRRLGENEDEIFTISYSNRITQIIPPCDPGYFLPHDKNRTTRVIRNPSGHASQHQSSNGRDLSPIPQNYEICALAFREIAYSQRDRCVRFENSTTEYHVFPSFHITSLV